MFAYLFNSACSHLTSFYLQQEKQSLNLPWQHQQLPSPWAPGAKQWDQSCAFRTPSALTAS